jgi:L-alanine-DL-glutamate epimerase-like enolase superfamily enzyme
LTKNPPISSVHAHAYTVPTDLPETDGTLEWDSTTIVIVDIEAGGRQGLGYSYTHASAATLINHTLAKIVGGQSALHPGACWRAMQRAVRNLGRSGLVATAISAVDIALWDLKAKLFDLPLASLLGGVRQVVPIYGSGGFTNYTNDQLADQLRDWVERDGCRFVKMKIGTDPAQDPSRVAAAKAAIGAAELFVDANGAYTVKQAQHLAQEFAAGQDVRWFEEPVSSDDLDGLRRVRDHVRSPMEVAAGEYGYDIDYFRRMLEAGAVDVQQADATRCGGVTGFLHAATLCDAFHTDLSAHCAPALHLHLGCAAPRLRHLEWFHDHVRIERLFFDGAPVPGNGVIAPDMSRAGLGLTLRQADASRFAAAS